MPCMCQQGYMMQVVIMSMHVSCVEDSSEESTDNSWEINIH